MTWGLTFDDGPSPYTPKVLNYLEDKKLKATFFIIGSNAIDKPEILQATYIAGHEIALHTWTHRPLTTLSNEEIIAELGWNRKAIKDITGVSPKSMRPPYGDIDDRVRAICKAMNIVPVLWQYDSNDWKVNLDSSKSAELLGDFNKLLDGASSLSTGFVSLQHDLTMQTVDLAVDHLLPAGMSHNPPFNLQPVNQCLKHTLASSYLETSGSAGSASAGANSTSPSGTASGTVNGTAARTASASGRASSAASSSASSAKSNGAVPRSVGFAGVGVVALLVGGLVAVL